MRTAEHTSMEAPASVVWFHPNEQLEELRAKEAQSSQWTNRPDSVRPTKITKYEGLFQPRELDEKHLADLVRALRHTDALEPLTVFQVGDELVLIDGHHRLEAYNRAGVTTPVPVRHFKGTLEDAVLEAGRSNSKAKLSMDARQRMNYAWRLVLMGGYSKAQIVEASCVSDGQVARMRRAKKALGEEAFGFSEWWRAQKRWQGDERDLSDEDLEERLDALAQENADRLAKTFSSKLSNNIALTARTFSIYFGRKLPELVEELQGYVEAEDEAEQNDDF